MVGASRLFPTAEERVLQLARDGNRLVGRLTKTLNWIDRLIDAVSKPFTADDRKPTILRQTAPKDCKAAFFRLILRSHNQPEKQVSLLFCLRDLYLLGFEKDGVLYLYDDADIAGSGYDKNHPNIKLLGFDGGYYDDCFQKFSVGFDMLEKAIDVLLKYEYDERAENSAAVRRALYLIIITISEAKRFPGWFKTLVRIFRQGLNEAAGNEFGHLFQNWSDISREIFKGAAKYTAIANITTFKSAVAAVSVLRRDTKIKENKN